MSKKIQSLFTGLALVILPVVTYAQDVESLIDTFSDIISSLVPVIISLAVLFFLWGLLKYVTAKGAEDKEGAMRTMITGIIVLFVMISIWGLVGIFQDTLGVGEDAAPNVNNLLPR